jgi:hypothetical protein
MKSFTYSTVVLSHVIAINFLYSSFLQHLHQARQRCHLKQPQLLTWNFDKPINRAVDIDNVFDHLKWNEEVGRWESDKE